LLTVNSEHTSAQRTHTAHSLTSEVSELQTSASLTNDRCSLQLGRSRDISHWPASSHAACRRYRQSRTVIVIADFSITKVLVSFTGFIMADN